MQLIHFDSKQRIFHLTNRWISYIISIEEQELLSHIYYGKKVTGYNHSLHYPRMERSFSMNFLGDTNRTYSRDTLLQEFSSLGSGDFRIPSIELEQINGDISSDFRYDSFKIYQGKRPLEGLPATYVEEDNEAQTLEINLIDHKSEVKVILNYTIYRDYPIITRSIAVKNNGTEKVVLTNIKSWTMDIPADEKDMIHLPGAWGNERMIQREQITRGIHTFDSKRGTSSHQENPFVAIVNSDTTEHTGDAHGFCLVYSGNHEESIEMDQYNQMRLTMGINSYGFRWVLQPGEVFQAPEVLSTYSPDGLNGMSQNFHHIINHRLIRGKYKQMTRPILINNWEATYFDFNEDKIKAIIDESEKLGVELFILDDGWFGQRHDDQRSLGDWTENKEKLPNGLAGLSEYTKSKKMLFGLWFEPEMISRDSELFENHPDWYLHVPGREAALSRSQYVLDLSRDEVADYIIKCLTNILDEVEIDYIKWDMNRYLSDVFSSNRNVHLQGRIYHQYVINLYRIFENITQRYPEILFEGCSGGGGRFDAGILYYMPQIWASDNSDAIARLKIQYGTSLVYPISTIGAHVSDIPNHQNGRKTSLKMRGDIASSGVLGYELDPTKLSISDKKDIKNQILFYKENRELILYGDFYRLSSPFEENQSCWSYVSANKKRILVVYANILSEAAPTLKILKLKGLIANSLYQLKNSEKVYYGDELMNIGFYQEPIFNQQDFESRIYLFEKINEDGVMRNVVE